MGFSSWLGRGRRGFFFRARYGTWFVRGGFVEGRGGEVLREGGLGLGFCGGGVGVGGGEVGRVWVLWLRVMGGWRLLVDGSGCGFGGGFLLGLNWVCKGWSWVGLGRGWIGFGGLIVGGGDS